MAGRIRSIKPEILEDERSAALSSDAWRLWVSMWLLADDYGRLRGTPSWLQSQVFWCAPTPVKVEDLLSELENAGVIIRYTVKGQRYIEITNWSKHQKVDKPGKPRIPSIDEGSRDPRETLATIRETPENVPETLATDLRSGSPTSDLDHRPPILPTEGAPNGAAQGFLAIQDPPKPKKAKKQQPNECYQLVEFYEQRWVSRFKPESGTAPKSKAAFGHAKALIAEHGLDVAFKYVAQFVADDDSFIAKRGHQFVDIASRVPAYKKAANAPPMRGGLPLSTSVDPETAKLVKF